MFMKYRFLVNKDKNKQGDIVQLRQDFWSKYYTTKGIIQPYEQLQIQDKPKTKKTTSKKKKGGKK